MIKVIIITVTFLLLTKSTYAQLDTTIWENAKIYENDEIKIEVPVVWNYFPIFSSPSIPFYFEGRGDYQIFINNNYVFTTILVTKMKNDFNNLDEVTKNIQDGYTDNPGRAFPEGPTSQVESFTTNSGETASLVSTKFFREFKGLQQSRFDLGLYNGKTKNAYMYTLIVQYADETYQLEETLKIREYAKRIYSRFSFK